MVTNLLTLPGQANVKRMLTVLLAALVLSLGALSLPAKATEAATTEVVTLAVENMTCALCPYTVRKSLQQVEGVVNAEVDFSKKTATVVFDPQKTGVESLTQATTHAGYPSTLKQ
ncbi:MAG: mercury resistance system periplasmic binding protein MerP [Motiliproteus sp.]|nr:mercury resistance system periplasmic binding protein MerP [Motiliproteus sp.]